ncbi:hypothetical protein SEVIR_4G236901v4 [Setaria viridis]|uniref:Secreted protein n=1 Tax=Setaria viridis TaxID=4556 RepID=A0A4U6V2G6_SETVI|nr:hypothetical protein SEVIR_4G236901v2 [Setaria viridis]
MLLLPAACCCCRCSCAALCRAAAGSCKAALRTGCKLSFTLVEDTCSSISVQVSNLCCIHDVLLSFPIASLCVCPL